MGEKWIFLIGALMLGVGAAGYLSDYIAYIRQGPEERDNPLTPCHVCGKEVSKTARFCPECGEDFMEVNFLSQSPKALLSIFIILFLLALGSLYLFIFD